MKILIAPGAFKHSLSASAVADAIARGLRRSGLDAVLHLLPIADGGNGTLDAFLAGGGQRYEVPVPDPIGHPIMAEYALLGDGETAVIEMALASGLELLRRDQLDPLRASTYGTGRLLQAALDAGAKRIIVGMGGSATVDGGAGCLQALGVRFLDVEAPVGGGSLRQIHTIDVSGLDPRWRDTEVIIASDVDNPTLGEQGAAAVFGPQKGASSDDVCVLEDNLRHFFTLVRDQLGVDVLDVKGGGAAGAFSAGLMAFLGGRIQPGIDLLLEYNHFRDHLRDAGLVITGEGQMDEQTIHGKGPMGVARLAREHGVPTIAIVGGLNVDDAVLHDAGIHAVLPIVTKPMSLDEAISRADELVERAALRLGYILRVR
jgi:glycerate 2-kinase